MSEDDYDYGELLVLQHGAATGPSALTPVLEGRSNRRPWRLIDPSTGEQLPALDPRTRGILVLGGMASATDPGTHAWMDAELEFLRAAVAAEVPVFGICLGAQLLATALGGAVERRDTPEVGFFGLSRTLGAADDEIFAGWPDGSMVLLSHEDEVVTLPDGAVEMLDGAGPSAWRTSDGRSYGVQFHPEASAATVAEWTTHEGYRALVAAAGVDPDELVAEVERRERFTLANGLALVGRWLDGVVGAGDPTPRKRRKAA